jgi:DNA-binding transcriptional MerR regulator
VSPRQRPEPDGRLKIGQLATRTDTPKETIHYYLRLGLLSPPLATSRNMAYYGERHVEELRLVAKLRAESYLPLDKIKRILDEGRLAARARELDVAGELFGRTAKVAAEPLDMAGLAARTGVPVPTLEAAVRAGLLGQGDGALGWEDLRLAEVIAEARGSAGDEALLERLEILDRHVQAMVEDELRHFFAMSGAGIEPERGLELLHGGRQTIGRYLTLARARRMRQGVERVLAEVDALARRSYSPYPAVPLSARAPEWSQDGSRGRQSRTAPIHPRHEDVAESESALVLGGAADLEAAAAWADRRLLLGDYAEVVARADEIRRARDPGVALASCAAEACVELGLYPQALAWIEPVRAEVEPRARTVRQELVWAAAVLARLRDALAAPAEPGAPWSALARLRGDVVHDLIGALTTLARVSARLEVEPSPLVVARAALLLGRIYAGTPRFLGLGGAAEQALARAYDALSRLVDTPNDPGLGVTERLRAIIAAERARLVALGA